MYSSTLSSTSALDEVGGQRYAPAALPPGKTRYPWYRWPDGTRRRSGRVRKIPPPPRIRSPDRPARSKPLHRLSYRGPQPACPTLNSVFAGLMAYDTKTAILQCKIWTSVFGSFLPSFFTYLPPSLLFSLPVYFYFSSLGLSCFPLMPLVFLPASSAARQHFPLIRRSLGYV